MDRTNVGERAFAAPVGSSEALDFVRFCHRRRRVGWPELYDEMCAVAGRGIYRGFGADELAAIGIGFGLFEMPALAGLVAQVVAEELERRRRAAAAVVASIGAAVTDQLVTASGGAEAADTADPRRTHHGSNPDEAGLAEHGPIRIAVAAGA